MRTYVGNSGYLTIKGHTNVIMKEAARLLWVDGLKGFSVIAVLLAHIGGMITPHHTLGNIKMPIVHIIITCYIAYCNKLIKWWWAKL